LEQYKADNLKTILYNKHCALGARMVDFCGWEMPLQYKGIIQEHHAVRNAVGLFDVSHMGRVVVRGPQAEVFLDYLATNDIAGKHDYSATYTVLCNEKGLCIDDAIIYRVNSTEFFIVVNAGNRTKGLFHLQEEGVRFDVEILPRYEREGILALQGPLADQLLARFVPSVTKIKPMHFIEVQNGDVRLIIARTGYTGAGGFEIYALNERISFWWDALLKAGEAEGIVPAGLGARDTLRLEMGYALYGHEISEVIAPTESVAAWAVKMDKDNFIGKEALVALEASGKRRFEYGVILQEPGIAREGYVVELEGTVVGYVTSGTFSPTLQKATAIVLIDIPLKVDDVVKIQIRQNFCEAKIVKLPFLRGSL
jgi:aminomethyltransferase